ncbi:MAG: hypothetical protein HC896_07225 [Bacteroidales bacterium]|nr:hypothetical protein [Bacteroidales bacterium]
MFKGDTVYSQDVFAYMVYPNPLNPSKYVAVISTTSATGLSFTDRLPSVFGFYDYSFVELKTQKPLMAGFFNENWE